MDTFPLETRLTKKHNNLIGNYEAEVCNLYGIEREIGFFENRKIVYLGSQRTRAKVGWKFYTLSTLLFIDTGERILVNSSELARGKRKQNV